MRPDHLHRPSSESGIALIAAVLVVLLSALLIVTYMSTTVGERQISSNVHVAKEALYAADAGVRTVEQDIANKAQFRYDSLVTVWNGNGSTGQILSTTMVGNFFAGGIVSSQAATNPNFTASATIAFASDTITATKQTYVYRYTVTSAGAAGAAGTRKVQADGVILLSASRGSFSDYLMFMQQQQMSNGSNIWFTSSTSFDGRVHANGQMHFAFKPTFQDLVTSTSANAMFNNNGNNLTLNANNNGTIDVPSFYNGFQRGVASVPLPMNVYSQQNQALSQSLDISNTTTAQTNAAINTYLGTSNGNSAPPTGVYVPNSGGSTPTATGGIYVEGDVTQLKMWADTTSNKQWYQFTQGSTVTSIVVDRAAGQTKVWNSATTTGTPLHTYGNTPPVGALYVDGGINDLRGPDRSNGTVPPAIAEGTNLLITTQKDIVIQRDVTVDSYSSNDAVLGLFTLNGGVRVGTSAPNDCNVDAFIMAPATTSASYNGWSSNMPGQFSVDSYDSGNSRGTFHLRGGIVEQYYGPFFTFDANSGAQLTGMARDYHYDRRGLIPHGFPGTSNFTSTAPTARTLAWKEI